MSNCPTPFQVPKVDLVQGRVLTSEISLPQPPFPVTSHNQCRTFIPPDEKSDHSSGQADWPRRKYPLSGIWKVLHDLASSYPILWWNTAANMPHPWAQTFQSVCLCLTLEDEEKPSKERQYKTKIRTNYLRGKWDESRSKWKIPRTLPESTDLEKETRKKKLERQED